MTQACRAGVPTVVQRNQPHLGSSGRQVRSQVQHSGLRIQLCLSCGSGCNYGLDLILGPGTLYAERRPKTGRKREQSRGQHHHPGLRQSPTCACTSVILVGVPGPSPKVQPGLKTQSNRPLGHGPDVWVPRARLVLAQSWDRAGPAQAEPQTPGRGGAGSWEPAPKRSLGLRSCSSCKSGAL